MRNYQIDFDFVQESLKSLANYEAKRMSRTGGKIFLAATSKIDSSNYQFAELPCIIKVRLGIECSKFIRTLPWYQRFVYDGYVRAAFDLGWRVYESVYKQTVSGGEGEGRIFGKVQF